jgi:hypothetical protein
MFVHGGQQRRRRDGQLVERGHRAERSQRILTDPALEFEHSASLLALQADDPIRKLDNGRLRGERLGGRATPGDDRRFGRRGLQLQIRLECLQACDSGGGGAAPDPGVRDFARDRKSDLREFRACEARLRLGKVTSQTTFLRRRELLHHPDPAHRHEVPRRRIRVGTGDRQVVETYNELGVRQPACAHGERLRRILAGYLCDELRGLQQRLLDSCLQGQCLRIRRRLAARVTSGASSRNSSARN